jgi:hypothetical protein
MSNFGVCKHPIAWAVVAMAAGCGEGPRDDLPREPVSGRVTLDGTPVTSGTIQFIPDGHGDRPTSAASAEIVAGNYSIARAGGPVPGPYKVIISGSQVPGVAAPAEPPGSTSPLAPELIPAEYNAKTKLTVEVKAGGPNAFPFDLKK